MPRCISGTIAIAAVTAALCVHSATPPPAAAQPVEVGPDTRLRSVEFRFAAQRSFDSDALRGVLGQVWQGRYVGLRRRLDFLPFVEPVPDVPFDPVELQRDVVRLREFYRREGFSRTEVTYEVARDAEKDVLDVTFHIAEGRPFRLREFSVRDSTGAEVGSWLAQDLLSEWRNLLKDEIARTGARLGDTQARAHTQAVNKWFKDHGFPWAATRSQITRDDTTFTANQSIVVSPGARARIGDITVEGNQRVDASDIRNTLRIQQGDWFSAEHLEDGQRFLLSRDLFRVVTAEVPAQPHDETVDLRVRVEEGPPRSLTGEIGYETDSGLATRGEWKHHNFFGNARLLSIALIGETGIWAIDDQPSRLARLSITTQRPGLYHPRVSSIVNPFGEYRDDARDRSWGYGFNTGITYVGVGITQTASIQYQLSARQVLEDREGAPGQNFLDELEEALLGTDATTHSAIVVGGAFGYEDRPINPRRVFMLRPTVETTVPTAWSTGAFVRTDLGISAARPISKRTSWAFRGAFGRMFPFGKSVPVSPEVDGVRKFFELRDRAFTAGGSDVRGWQSQLLGPKFPDLTVSEDSTQVTADRYVALGGLARIALSFELRLPLAGVKWGSHVFVDGGRVWNPDDRFLSPAVTEEDFFWSTGVGISRETPVGPLRASLAYMINPTQLDLLRAQEFVNAFAVDAVEEQDTHWQRRLRFHLAIGTGF